MQEQSLPLDIGFAPWTPRTGSRSTLSAATRQLLQQVATSEINQDYNAQTNLDSMYFSGKALAKFAMIVCKYFRSLYFLIWTGHVLRVLALWTCSEAHNIPSNK